MNKLWRRIVFLLLMVALPLFGIAATSMAYCQASQEEMVYAGTDKDTQCKDCAIPCSTAHAESCDLGAACGACIAPLALAPGLFHSALLLPVYPIPAATDYVSHIVELLERPPMIG